MLVSLLISPPVRVCDAVTWTLSFRSDRPKKTVNLDHTPDIAVSLEGLHFFATPRDLDKGGYQVNSFFISQRKHMLWVLIRSASLRCF